MPFLPAKAAFVVLLVINFVLWSHSSYGSIPAARQSVLSQSHLLKRALLGHPVEYGSFVELERECRPISVPVHEQCALVNESCPTTDTFLSIPYLKHYFCASPAARPFVFAALLVWLVFLFSTLGISASDFFCPNLATIAQLLGLDENVAGVTFLAFGNGSPDVFATFSAMRSNSGSLAIGELLGAASFIVSCVVGSMCIIKPFAVHRGPFLRDIGFFTIAVLLLLFILWDGSIHAWEAGLLVLLYLTYVVVVVAGSWWDRRQERLRYKDAQIRSEYAEEGTSQPYFDQEPYRDEPTPIPTHAPSSLQVPHSRPRAISHPTPPRLGVETHITRSASDSRSPSPSPHRSHMPSFSLVGALEFRQVIASLQSQATSSSLGMFEAPMTPFPGGHYHRHSWSQSLSRPHTPVSGDEDANPWDASYMGSVQLNDRSPINTAPPPLPDVSPRDTSTPLIRIVDDPINEIPVISHTPASPTSPSDSIPPLKISRRRRVLYVLKRAHHILFPTFHRFRSKTVLRKIAAVFAAPAVFALTVTLPVTVTPYDSSTHHHEKGLASADSLTMFEEEGIERTLIAEEEVQEEMHELKFNKWLMAAQCALGPLFCAAVLCKGMRHEGWIMLGVGLAGLAAGALVAVFGDKGDLPPYHLVRCFMGFTVAIVWIMAIADEVVKVLQTFGFIFGLSDAIIGLTVFAVGNSLADLVANMSVAVFAPVMGFSACFGGPMLNMLLGVGISGSYIIHQTARPYVLDFSTTLLVSGIGLLALLLATMVFVPLNDYYLPRKWGFFLIGCYTVIMSINVVVEVVQE
ncbi:hypothetical protein FA95DRAFT_1604073 [Auriscalpium vulgare]|uniref:Uncharacterized protein n=1 Tax=Auriscalpium vulgare TaxID=40419 RepID=A0ACB8S1L4_9AGAM|nr:hypothetical protein FA95DRAFT_1604073 [Auriscalpium vulgare]